MMSWRRVRPPLARPKPVVVGDALDDFDLRPRAESRRPATRLEVGWRSSTGAKPTRAPGLLALLRPRRDGHAAPPRTPRNSRRLMIAPWLRRGHRIGSNEML